MSSNPDFTNYNEVNFYEGHSTKYHNFFVGSAIFAAIALVLGCFLPFYVGYKTRDASMKSTNMWMACGLSWLALFYMWISWSTFYQAQMYPYLTIGPKVEATSSE